MPRAARSPHERRVRASARLALYVALVATALAIPLLLRLAEPPTPAEMEKIEALQGLWQGIDFLAYPEVRMLRELVAIDSSEPSPNELSAAEYLAGKLRAVGLSPTIEHMGDRRANLWAFVEGEDPKALVLSGHLDVEPAIGQEGWLYPPFGGAIDGPWIYGRGMYDMKSLTIAQLLATLDVATSGKRPKRSLLFVATSSEEAGSDAGTRWILREHPELVRRMGVVLTEGGVVEAVSAADIKYWGIEFAQKRVARVEFCGANRQQLEELADLLRATGKGDAEPYVSPPVREFLAAYGSSRGLGSYRRLLADPDRIVLERPRYDQLTNFMRALFRNEVVPFEVVADPEGGYSLTVGVQLLPEADLEAVLGALLPDWKWRGITRRVTRDLGARSASPLDSREYRALVETIRRDYPEVPVGPYFLPWTATDARFYRELGIPAYGFSPFLLAVTETLQIARPNERMQLPGFVQGVARYRRLVRELVE